MEKPCNGRKNLVTGYSHGWSLMTIRLSVRILQLSLNFHPTHPPRPKTKKVGKCSFSSLFQAGLVPRGSQACMSRGRVSSFLCLSQQAGAAASGSGSALPTPDSCSNGCGVSLLGTAQLTSLPAALAAPQSTVKVTVSDFPIPGHCCAESSPPAVYAFHT